MILPNLSMLRMGKYLVFNNVRRCSCVLECCNTEKDLIFYLFSMLFFLDNVEPYSDGTPSAKVSNKENKQSYSIARSGEYI